MFNQIDVYTEEELKELMFIRFGGLSGWGRVERTDPLPAGAVDLVGVGVFVRMGDQQYQRQFLLSDTHCAAKVGKPSFLH